MNLIVNRSLDHTTRDGFTACICTLIDAITGELAGCFEVVFTDAGHLYRSVTGTPYPAGIDLTEATRYAISEATDLGVPAAA